MRRSSTSNALLAIAILILLSNSSMAVLVDQSDLSQGITVNGGRTILVEEITATWCISCTEIDPYLEEVADSHGSRISLVALHPQDGVDVFANEASEKELKELKQIMEIIRVPLHFQSTVLIIMRDQIRGQAFKEKY